MKRGKMETGCWSGPSSLSLLDPDEARYAELRRQICRVDLTRFGGRFSYAA